MRVVTVYSALGKNTAMKRRTDQVVQLCSASLRPDGACVVGMMAKWIADLAVVKDALGRADVVVVQRGEGVGRQVAHAAVGQHFKRLLGHGQIVFGQRARVGTRVGQGLVAFVQALRQGQRGLGAEAELAVGPRCRLVRSNSRGDAWVVGLLSSVTVACLPRTALAMACASAADHAVGFGLRVLALLPLGVEPLGGVFAGLGAKGGVDSQ